MLKRHHVWIIVLLQSIQATDTMILLKKVLDQCANACESDPDASNLEAYNTVIQYTASVDAFLQTHPEYAQQVVMCIIHKMIKTDDISPPDKALLRSIHSKKFFLGELAYKSLNQVIAYINCKNKNL